MKSKTELARELKTIKKDIISYKTSQYTTGDSYHYYKIAVDIEPLYINDATQAWKRNYKITVIPDNPNDELVVWYYPDSVGYVFQLSFTERSFDDQKIIYYMMPALQQSARQYVDEYLPKHIVIYSNCPFSVDTTYTDTRVY